MTGHPLNRSAHREVWRLAMPMILSNITVPALGMVDTAVIGHLPSAHYLGAVTLGALVFSFLYLGFNFLRMGTTGLTAQALGSGDGDELRAGLGRGLLLAVGLGILLLLAQRPVAWAAFYFLDAAPDILAGARNYFDVRIWSAPATLANYVLLGWFLGMQKVRIPLLLLTVVNGINIALDLLFVNVLKLGVPGVALASVLADYSGLLLGVMLAARVLGNFPGVWSGSLLICRERVQRLFTVNGDIFVRTLCLISAFAFFTLQGAKLGELTLAANAVLMNFQTFMAYALDGFAHAAEAMVGRAVGARRWSALSAALKATLFWSVLVSGAFSLFYLIAGEWGIALLTDLPAVRAMAMEFLPWLVLSPVVSVWSYWFDGVFVGATLSRQMRNTMIVSALLIYLPVWSLTRPLGNHGLWLALLVFMAARALTMGFVGWGLWRRRALPTPG